MRPVRDTVLVILLVNALALTALLGWLGLTGRLNRERLRSVAETFATPVAEQGRRDKALSDQLEQARARIDELQHLLTVSAQPRGPVTAETGQQIRAVSAEIAALRQRGAAEQFEAQKRQLALMREELERRRQQLLTDREQIQAYVAEQTQQIEDRDFQHAVKLYENLMARQAKQLFWELIQDGQREQVVEYLAAMQVRKAAKVLKEFRAADELEVAADLLEELRQRGVAPAVNLARAGGGDA